MLFDISSAYWRFQVFAMPVWGCVIPWQLRVFPLPAQINIFHLLSKWLLSLIMRPLILVSLHVLIDVMFFPIWQMDALVQSLKFPLPPAAIYWLRSN